MWALYFILLEFIQYRFGSTSKKRTYEFTDFWNVLDISRILLLLILFFEGEVWEDKNPVFSILKINQSEQRYKGLTVTGLVFAFLIMVSWLTLL